MDVHDLLLNDWYDQHSPNFFFFFFKSVGVCD